MNVAVSPTNPIKGKGKKQSSFPDRPTLVYEQQRDDVPINLPPSAFHISVVHSNAKIRTRASSERVCISSSRLRRLRRSEDVLGTCATTERRHDTKHRGGVFGGSVSEEAVTPGGDDGVGKCTAIGTWASTCGTRVDNLSSRQKTA